MSKITLNMIEEMFSYKLQERKYFFKKVKLLGTT